MFNELEIMQAALEDQRAELGRRNTRIEELTGQVQTLKKFIVKHHPELVQVSHEASPDFPPEFDTEEIVRKLLQALRSAPGQTVGQLAKQMGLTTRQTSDLLMMLRKQGIIRSEGARRACRYYMA